MDSKEANKSLFVFDRHQRPIIQFLLDEIERLNADLQDRTSAAIYTTRLAFNTPANTFVNLTAQTDRLTTENLWLWEEKTQLECEIKETTGTFDFR